MANKAINSLTYGSDTYVFTLPYGTCSVAAGTAAKTVTVANSKFSLESGAKVTVKFTNANTVASPTLNVNSTGAKAIYWHGAALPASQYWVAGAVLNFVYNGTQWDLIGVADISKLEGLVGDTAVSTQISNAVGAITPASIGAAESSHTHSYAASSHNHSADNITSGTLPVSRGGTGNTSVDTTPTNGSTKMVTSGGVYTALSGKSDTGHTHNYAAASHGNHVPTTETANNAKFLRNDNSWQTVTPANIGAAASSHSHSEYAASSHTHDYAASSHTHDDRYYTETEVNTKFSNMVGDTAVSTQITNAVGAIPNATTSTSGHMSSTDKTKLDATNIAYGACSTAAATAAKVVTVSGNTNWKLAAGSTISVFFTETNTASNPTLNVNGTGAKNIYYGASQITTSSLGYAGTASRLMTFVYDGTQYRFVSWGYDSNTTYTNVKLGHGYATCSTAAATTAKVGTLSSYTLTTGGIVAVKFTYDVPASATLNINSKGAKSIYHKGAAIKAGVIKAGDIATFIYSSQYHLISIDRDIDVTHPDVTAGTASGSSGTLSHGGTFTIPSITYDANGHITEATTTTCTLPAAGGTTYTHPTTSGNKHIPSGGSSGQILRWSADGTAVWGADNDTVYTHPTTSGNKHIPSGGSSGQFLKWSADGTATWASDNNTTYTFATGDSNGQIKVTPSGGSASNISVKGLGSAAYTASTAYATAAQGTLATNAMPKAGGTFTGDVTHNTGTYFNASTYMKNNIGYNAYGTDGTAAILLCLDANNELLVGSSAYPHAGGTTIQSPNGGVTLKAPTSIIQLDGKYSSVALNSYTADNYEGGWCPLTEYDGTVALGQSNRRWYKVYATTTSIGTSDEREKSDIMSIGDYPVMYSRDGEGNIFEQLFDKLVPTTYTLNIEKTNDMHIGFIAQDIVKSMEELGLTEDMFGLVDHEYWTDEKTGEEKDRYGLAYTEFIALNTYMIQKQKAKIATLEERIAQLEELVNSN